MKFIFLWKYKLLLLFYLFKEDNNNKKKIAKYIKNFFIISG